MQRQLNIDMQRPVAPRVERLVMCIRRRAGVIIVQAAPHKARGNLIEKSRVLLGLRDVWLVVGELLVDTEVVLLLDGCK